ncbi:hypothetical protein [Natronolimnohabitans innermongolicus]|uniref:Uncharacterized protein n=1 Tax=Natronolimnohabitans innermongolicus JCM 12255 TaxID=1227499 RepID=L9X1I1_9EURY|nr:hypothetical protein [Natronolimnohabitans innermongolicus]ELY55570.1 hypothetical protein C493_11422 [Natronolimnohabitans innermongolicus JCM 12255]
MDPDQPPIPPEALPPGWGSVDCCDGHLEYRHRQPPIELVADRTSADRSHPGLGLCQCWELCYRYSLGDRTVTESIERVSTRHAAVDGLLECMRSINETAAELADPIAVRNALEQVQFSGCVPDGVSKE